MKHKKDCYHHGKMLYPSHKKEGFCYEKMKKCKIKGCADFLSIDDWWEKEKQIPSKEPLSEEELYGDARNRSEYIGIRSGKGGSYNPYK